ncbi:MAG TPA: caspase family protein [Steroidobacteraceae bacterium]|nr:caspase family protein [Steroidobacteraceae bacterium]
MRRHELRALTLIAACIALLAPLGASATDAAATRPRAALVIGNAAYTAVNPLHNPANDAHDMCAALGELGYKVSCFVDVADRREFKARIQDFVESLAAKSDVLFYYAGHAVQLKGENYLVPTGAQLRTEADVARETISLNFLMTQLSQAKHNLNIVVLDACRNNPWPGSVHGATAGLAPITAIPRGSMVLYATAANDFSDDGEGRNGTLTKNLLAVIKVPGLTVDEVFKRVSEGVQADSLAAAGHAQTPALYTNFSGEFCFAGCIDKVARAELEKIQKANEEQLQKAEREKAALQAQLAATETSMNCDQSVLSYDGQCFTAPPERTLGAVTEALLQRGFTIDDSNAALGTVGGTRSTSDPKDESATLVVHADAKVRAVPVTGHSVVTIAASQQTVLHQKSHQWTQLVLIPIPTATNYRNVVKNDVSITEPQFYRDLFAAIEHNLRSTTAGSARANEAPQPPPAAASAGSDSDTPATDTRAAGAAALIAAGTGAASAAIPATAPGTTAATAAPGTTTATAPTGAPADGLGQAEQPAQTEHPTQTERATQQPEPPTQPERPAQAAVPPSSGSAEQVNLPPGQALHVVVQSLVQRGYIIQSVDAAVGLVKAMRKVRDPKDESGTSIIVASAYVTAVPDANGSRVQLTANEQKLLHRKQTATIRDAGITDAGFYRDLFATIQAAAAGGALTAPGHVQHFGVPYEKTFPAVVDGLVQEGFTVEQVDDKVGFVTASRSVPDAKDRKISNIVTATCYVRPDQGGASLMFVAASQQSLRFSGTGSSSYLSRALFGSFTGRGSAGMDTVYGPLVTQEGELTDPVFYSRLFALIASKVGGDAPLLEASQTPTKKR